MRASYRVEEYAQSKFVTSKLFQKIFRKHIFDVTSTTLNHNWLSNKMDAFEDFSTFFQFVFNMIVFYFDIFTSAIQEPKVVLVLLAFITGMDDYLL